MAQQLKGFPMNDVIATDAPQALTGMQSMLAQHLSQMCGEVAEPLSLLLVANTNESGIYLLAGNQGQPTPADHMELVAAAVSGIGNLMRPPKGHAMHNAPAITIGLAVLTQFAMQQIAQDAQQVGTVGDLYPTKETGATN